MSEETKNPTENPEPTGRLPAHLTPGNPGNSGGKKGRSGRKPDEFKDAMRALASSRKADAYLKRCVEGEFGPRFFLAALAYAADRGYGRPAQSVEVSGPGGGPIPTEIAITRRVVDVGDSGA